MSVLVDSSKTFTTAVYIDRKPYSWCYDKKGPGPIGLINEEIIGSDDEDEKV